MKNHMNICIKNPYNNETRETQVKLQTQSTLHGKVGSVVNQMDARKAYAYMIIVDEQPFSFVEKQGFRNFVSVVCPFFQIPSRTTVTRDFYDLNSEENSKLKSFLKLSSKRISLTTELWTFEQRINYMCLTVHSIDDDWVLPKKVLNFCPIDGHKGEVIRKVVEKCLLEWELDSQLLLIMQVQMTLLLGI
ncbi:hypothetical protein M9H77_31329 [Catharanthus roseus]|uniref:Uncharacterized protein n=1 Tax=Catharanthus roseus TaxID=4058 RepID=A0ACC0A115_CATRO|nr:hypothetical protein M9H77_31329 [Catharanthus roseus]